MTRNTRVARLDATLTAVGGVLILASTLPVVGFRLEGVTTIFVPFGARVTGHVASVVVGFMMLALAGQLARRKHMAWIITVYLFLLSMISTAFRGPRLGAMAFALVMVGILFVNRHEFRAPPDPPTLFAVVRFVPIFLITAFVYGYLTIAIERHHITPAPTPWSSAVEISKGLVGVSGQYGYEHQFTARAFPASLFALGIVGVSYMLLLVFRPFVVPAQQGSGDWARAWNLVHEYGTESLDYFALRSDKQFFFSGDGRAMLAFTYLGRYALVSGDPVGHPDSLNLVVEEFVATCRDRAWGIAFLAVREVDRDRYIDQGLHTFYLGDEAVIDCRGFSLAGKRWKSIRQSAQRIERTYRYEFIAEDTASAEMLEKLNAISARWRGKAPERGFTMTLSQSLDGGNPDSRLCIALDEQGEPGGFLRIVPIFGEHSGYTLDLMRRDPDTPNGMTEFLLTRTIMHLDQLGHERLSMNFAAWGRLFDTDIDYSLRQRFAKWVLERMNPYFQIRSLKEFNQRFHPMWVSRAIAYDDMRALPRIGLLYGSVEGLLRLPFVGRHFLPRTLTQPGTSIGPPDSGRVDRDPRG